jgi:putative transposase
MMISYKYPIFPSNITQWKLAENLDACRWLYNRLLQDLNEAKRKGITLKTYDSQNMIPSLKLVNPKLNLVCALQDAVVRAPTYCLNQQRLPRSQEPCQS